MTIRIDAVCRAILVAGLLTCTVSGKHTTIVRVARQTPRIEPGTSKENPTNVCSIEVLSSEEPFDCPPDSEYPSIKNGSNGEAYIKCGEKTFDFEQIQVRLKDGERRLNGCKIHCCLLSYMGRLMNKCPDIEEYACYIDDTDNTKALTPLCGPPKIKMECKCYQSQIGVSDEDNLPWCNSHTNGEQCRHTTATDDGAQLMCICNRTRGEDSKSIQCTKLHGQSSQQKVCSIQLQSSKEPSDCSKANHNNYYQHIFEDNGKVYVECGGNNYTFEDIQERLEKNDKIIDKCTDESNTKRRISCCILSYMGNLINECPGSEKYECYTDETSDSYSLKAQCGAPKVKLGCKCDQSQIPIYRHDKLPLCDYYVDDAECRYDTVTDDVHFRCICNTTQSTDDNLQDCSYTETNNAEFHKNAVFISSMPSKRKSADKRLGGCICPIAQSWMAAKLRKYCTCFSNSRFPWCSYRIYLQILSDYCTIVPHTMNNRIIFIILGISLYYFKQGTNYMHQ